MGLFMSKKKIVLIDGHSILTRAFFGVPDLTNVDGLHTNAVYGFLNIMFKILEEEKPDGLFVAFDVKAPTFRHKMYEAYKGTRKPMPQELHEQVPLIQEVLKTMHITVMTKEGYEADDILGTVARQAREKDYDVVIVSGDRDLLQLAEERVLIRIPKTKKGGTEIENYYAVDVKETYGVTPKAFIDMKGLMGDTADNIPGVRSIGEKTASKLIQEYGTIENIYQNIDSVKPARVQNALIAGEEDAKLSKILATINVNSPVEPDLEQCDIEQMYNEESCQIIRKLGFKSLLHRFSGTTEEKEQEFAPLKSAVRITSAEKLSGLEKKIMDGNEPVGYAIYPGNEFQNAKVCLASGQEIYLVEQSEEIGQEGLRQLLCRFVEQGTTVCLFDLKSILKQVPLQMTDHLIYDCMVCAYLLDPLQDTYGYDYLLNRYFGIQTESRPEIAGKKSMDGLAMEEPDKLDQILASEALTAVMAGPELEKELKEKAMYDLYRQIEYPLIYVLDDMEKAGVKIDEQALKQYSDELAVKIHQIEQEIYAETGEEFNINSPKQLGIILFEKMGLKGGKKTKTGYSTSAEVLEKLAGDTPVVEKILEYRQLTKLKSTYADGLRTFIAQDGRIHGTFNQTITATGRISSTDPNLQNIPIRMDIGKKIREVFIPKEDYHFVDADYSQIELRILAHMSEDQHLIEAYNSEQDIHRITAAKVFHVPFEEVTPELRRSAKAVNFGIVYGISSFGLSQDLDIDRKQAAEYINQYFETYPKVKEFLDRMVENAKKDGYVTTIFGRRRPIPELKSSNFMQRLFGERAAMNSAVQGTAADIMKIAMIRVYCRLKEEKLKSRLLLQVHDEILIETASDELEQVKEIVLHEMTGAAELSVRLEVGIECGMNWLEAH